MTKLDDFYLVPGLYKVNYTFEVYNTQKYDFDVVRVFEPILKSLFVAGFVRPQYVNNFSITDITKVSYFEEYNINE